jgi:hypothetical protein
VIQNVIGAPSQALQIIFEMQSQMTRQKSLAMKIRFFQIVKHMFFHFSLPNASIGGL